MASVFRKRKRSVACFLLLALILISASPVMAAEEPSGNASNSVLRTAGNIGATLVTLPLLANPITWLGAIPFGLTSFGAVNASAITDGAKEAGGWALDKILGGVQVIVTALLFIVLWFLSQLLAIVGWLLNWIFKFTVVDIKTSFEAINAIDVGWTAVRDIANISFIFILLYLAIATILQLDEHGVKKSLARLVIAAMLVNFSLFFVKVIIDVPNILAIQIYNKALSGIKGTVFGVEMGEGGLGDAFYQIIVPHKVYQPPKQSSEPTIQSGAMSAGALAASVGTTAQVSNMSQNPITTVLMGIILMVIAIAVFLSVLIIFVKRFVMLIFYMIFSPLAFAGMAIPIHGLQSAAKEKFWMGLIKESFYAPIFMICVYITLVVGFNLNNLPQPEGLSGFNLGVGNIISYIVVIVMLVASLFIAEMMGVKGAAGAMGMYKKITGSALGAAGWVGGATFRSTVGRKAEEYWNKRYSQQLLTWSGGIDAHGKPVGFFTKWGARGAVKALKGISRGYRETTLAGEKAHMEEAFEEVHMDPKALAGKAAAAWGKDKDGKYRYSTQNQVFEQIHHGWSADRHADVMMELERLVKKGGPEAVGAQGALERLYTSEHRRVDPEMWDKIQTMVRNGRPAHLDEAKDAAERARNTSHPRHDPNAFNNFINDPNTTDGQRRFVAMRLKEGETTKDQTMRLMQIIANKDPSGLEAVLRDSMSATSTREVAQNILMWSKVRKVTATTLEEAAKSGAALANDIKMLAEQQLYGLEDVKKALADKKYNYGRGYSSFADIEASPGGYKELVEAYTALHGAQDTNFANAADNHKRYVFATDETKDAKAIIDKYDKRK